MIVQISSGQGQAECELAVRKLLESLKKECRDMVILDEHKSRFSDELTSVTFETQTDFSDMKKQYRIILSLKQVSRSENLQNAITVTIRRLNTITINQG